MNKNHGFPTTRKKTRDWYGAVLVVSVFFALMLFIIVAFARACNPF